MRYTPGMEAADLLLDQLLAWVAARPRNYGEAMEAWRTSCPRLPVWEDAVAAGHVVVDAAAPRATLSLVPVRLTAAGRARLGA